jgi:DNA-binding NarL/FixJ family response regulator
MNPPLHGRMLTPREREIVEAMMTAASNKAIAHRLGLTEQSVKNRLTALYRKLGVSNRLELVIKLMTRDA